MCDKQQGGLGHRRLWLDESLDSPPGAEELRKMLEIGLINRPSEGTDGSGTTPKPSHRSSSRSIPQGYVGPTCRGAPDCIDRVAK
ncbi:hypothetical protein GCM10025331_75000 [Actinoplanes utahensis]|nr:hypothetical protein Aut01nite_42830 [Actinoplanes utahensis]